MSNRTISRRKLKPAARKATKANAVHEMRVGTRLRHARLMLGHTLRKVADAAGCSESLISKIENDKATPSFATLHRLASILGINFSALFIENDDSGQVVSHAGERPVILTDQLRTGKGIRLERLIPYSRDHLLQGNIHLIAPGGRSDGAIVHSGEEVGYVLEGEIELVVNGRSFKMKAGDSFHFRSELPHSYRNVGPKSARVIWINTPPTF